MKTQLTRITSVRNRLKNLKQQSRSEHWNFKTSNKSKCKRKLYPATQIQSCLSSPLVYSLHSRDFNNIMVLQIIIRLKGFIIDLQIPWFSCIKVTWTFTPVLTFLNSSFNSSISNFNIIMKGAKNSC